MQGKFSGFGVCLRQQVTANKNPKRSLYTHAKVHIFLSLVINDNEQGFKSGDRSSCSDRVHDARRSISHHITK